MQLKKIPYNFALKFKWIPISLYKALINFKYKKDHDHYALLNIYYLFFVERNLSIRHNNTIAND